MKRQHKPNESMQKGRRRQKLHDNQDNRGTTKKNPPAYQNFEGEDIE